ncbi:MAG: hypothetical protein HYY04_17090 [Chloroflexi bacterium]|nr:hypothetical protein [Chloroflexota bacterium]
MRELARKPVQLRRTGGSRAVILPRKWLEAHQIEDAADLVLTDEAILVVPRGQPSYTIEDEPEFAQFLAYVTRDALSHPDRLGDIGELMAGDEELLADVEVE